MKHKGSFKQHKGITLVALVVTIIVLVILAGISISLLFGENGIVTKAKAGAENYQIAANEEASDLANLQSAFNSNTSGKSGKLTLSEIEGNYKSNETKTFEVTENESGGELSVETDAPSVATASISGNTVTVTAGTTAGEATITVKSAAKGDYKERITTYTATVENGTISLSATAYSGNYDGTAHNAFTNVTVDPSDCIIEYKLNDGEYTTTMPQVTGAEEYTISIKASKEGYVTETITETVKVGQASASNFTVTLPYSTVEYTGSAITPLPTVKYGSRTLTANTDYTVSYSNNTNTGTATVTITGKGNYAGTKTATFTIETPKRTTLQVGDTVSYSPSGTYSWNNEYASADQTGSTTLNSASGESFNINTWKVLSINGSTVEMVPTAQTTGTVRLQGAQGYNNAVKLLNDACSSLYSNSSKGITARSINMDDIEKIIINKGGYDPTTYVNTNNNNLHYGSQTASAYTSNKYYPTIYGQEKNRVINGSKSSSGLGLSEQTSLISRTASSATNGYLQASTSIQPYQTYYYLNNTDFSNYLGTTYKDIILPSGTSTTYWVASRCVSTNSSNCYFYVRNVNSGALNYRNVFYSNNNTGNISRALFPVVSLSSELISGNDVDGFRVN